MRSRTSKRWICTISIGRWRGSARGVGAATLGNTGCRRYLKAVRDDHFAIDPDRVEEDKKFDGIFVRRTTTHLNPLDAMLCYKQLWTVEQTFRTAKHLLSTRPIFHKLDETIRGYVFCSFLALALKKALEDRLAKPGVWVHSRDHVARPGDLLRALLHPSGEPQG
jgi:hypothetical protein